MDLPKMRQVIAIHRFGSFAKAAEALGMSQPSLSRSIARLEDELKIRIFDRSATGSALTPIGEQVLERLQRVVADADDLMRDASLFAGGEAGQVRIGISTALRGPFLQDFMLRAAQAHPNLRLHAEINSRGAMLPQLASRDLDLIFGVAQAREAADGAVVSTKLSELDFVAVAGTGHPLASQRGVAFSEFARHRYAGPAAPLVAAFFGVSPDELAPFYTANDYDALTPLVAANLATLIAPRHVVRPLVEAGRLVVLDLAWAIELDLVAVTTRAAADAPVVRKLIGYARAVVEALEARPMAA